MADDTTPNTPAEQPRGLAFLSASTSERFHLWVKSVGDEQAVTTILDFVVSGGTLAAFCSDNGFSYTTARRWLNKLPNRADAYIEARRERADYQAELIVEVSRRDCTMPVLDKDGVLVGTRVDPGKVQQAKLESDNLKWLAAKMNRDLYGDKVDVNATMDVRTATNDQLANELAAMGLGAVAAVLKGNEAKKLEDGNAALH